MSLVHSGKFGAGAPYETPEERLQRAGLSAQPTRSLQEAKALLGDRYCLAQPVERVRRDIPAYLKLVSTETLIAELDRRRALA